GIRVSCVGRREFFRFFLGAGIRYGSTALQASDIAKTHGASNQATRRVTRLRIRRSFFLESESAIKAKVALAGFLLLTGLSAAQQPRNLPDFCYDTRCRGAFCLHGEKGEATYCLGVRGFPSVDGEGNCCFCH